MFWTIAQIGLPTNTEHCYKGLKLFTLILAGRVALEAEQSTYAVSWTIGQVSARLGLLVLLFITNKPFSHLARIDKL